MSLALKSEADATVMVEVFITETTLVYLFTTSFISVFPCEYNSQGNRNIINNNIVVKNLNAIDSSGALSKLKNISKLIGLR